MGKYRIGKDQLATVVSLLEETLDVQSKFTITGPRESDRAVLLHIEEGVQRAEVSRWYVIGFSGMAMDVAHMEPLPNPREFYPHA